MLKSCQYCGNIHDKSFDCGKKPKRKYKARGFSTADKLRNTTKWQKKAKEIKERDKYLCVICMRNLYNTTTQYNYSNLSVHHIVSIEENADLYLDNLNLITLCEYHHHRCEESGDIPRDIQISIAAEQERNNIITF